MELYICQKKRIFLFVVDEQDYTRGYIVYSLEYSVRRRIETRNFFPVNDVVKAHYYVISPREREGEKAKLRDKKETTRARARTENVAA